MLISFFLFLSQLKDTKHTVYYQGVRPDFPLDDDVRHDLGSSLSSFVGAGHNFLVCSRIHLGWYRFDGSGYFRGWSPARLACSAFL